MPQVNFTNLTDRVAGREYKLRTPMGRFGQRRELLGAAVLLASDAASFINRTSIAFDRGFLASAVNA